MNLPPKAAKPRLGGGIEIASSNDSTEIKVLGGTIDTNAYCIAAWDDTSYKGNIHIKNANLISQTGRAIRNPSTTNTLTIEGFTQIEAQVYSAILSNTPNTFLGTLDSALTVVPMIKSAQVALEAPNGFKFYDGMLLGKTSAHTGTVIDLVDDCEVYYGELTLEGTTYKMATLGTYLMKRNYTVDANGVSSATLFRPSMVEIPVWINSEG